MRVHSCWAIDLNSGEGHGFAGILMWFEGRPSELPAHVQGNRTATWRTRREAREALKTVKRGWPNAKVSRVSVTVGEAA